jgi:hypothetical protein
VSIATGEAQLARYTSSACPRSPKTKKMGFNTPFFDKQASAWIMSRTTKKNIKASETKAHKIVSPTVLLLEVRFD